MSTNTRKYATLALMGAWLAAAALPADADTVDWRVQGPADWNDGNNWSIDGPNGPPLGSPPSIDFDDTASIINGGTAEISSGVGDVSGLAVGSGTLNINPGGSLNVAGAATIGGGGNVNLSGNANLDIGGDLVNNGRLRLTGSAANLDAANLSNNGTLIARITGANHSTIDVAGNAMLGGTLKLEFDNYTPTGTDKWTIIDAAGVFGSFAAVDTSGAPDLPFGAVFEVTVDQPTARVQVGLGGRLVARIDKGTGATSIRHTFGGPISLFGYSLESTANAFDPSAGNWNSLDDQNNGAWQEIGQPTAKLLAELNATGSSSLSSGQSLNLGAAYGFVPAAFGDSAEAPVSFKYASQGKVVEGLVEFVGRENDFVVTVNPATGDAVLENQSAFHGAPLIGYSIASPSGALRPATWTSLADQGDFGDWDEARPTQNLLSELNPLGETVFGTNTCISLGKIFATGGEEDLTLTYALETGQVRAGFIKYGALPSICTAPSTGPLGDTNGDGVVNIVDLNNVRNNFGSTGLGDTDGNNVVDISDLNNVRNNFGAGGSPAVPEPASWTILLCSCGGLWLAHRRRK